MTPGERVRVLFATTAFPARDGDPRGHHVFSLAKQIVSAGASVSVVAPAAPGCAMAENLSGIDVTRFSYWPFRGTQLATGVSGIVPNLRAHPALALQVLPLTLRMARAVGSLVGGFDIIHAHWVYPTGLVSLRAARSAGVPLVVTAHGGDVNMAAKVPGLRQLARRVANAADRVLAVSDDLAGKLIDIGVNPDCIEVVPLGVDVPRFSRDGVVTARPRVVYVGSLIERKNVAALIEALHVLPRGLVDADIVGDGPERGRLEELVSRLAVGEDVTFHGALAPSEAHRIAGRADMLVLPSRSEGRPVVVMEAMAAGVPVIASDIPGTRELVVDGESGVLIDPKVPAQLAAAIRDLAANPELRASYAAAGLERLHRLSLTGAAAAARHVDVYSRVLEVRRG